MENNKGVRIATLALAAFCMAFAMNFGFYLVTASDPSPLQDFCVAVNEPYNGVFVNGKFCKDPRNVTIDDFTRKGFNIPADTNNTQGVNTTILDVHAFPGLNTLGIAISRIDYGPFGLNIPHLHPRASEVFTLLEGCLYAGFVTTANKLFSTVLNEGDVMAFPQGLIHFQINLSDKKAVAVAAFGSQNQGRVNIADALFGTKPSIWDDVLTKAFMVDQNVINQLRAQFLPRDISIDAEDSVIKPGSQAF